MIKKFSIDLSKISGYIEGEEDKKIWGQLRKKGLYGPNFLYSVFNGAREKQILETGNYRVRNPDSIFALTKEELVWSGEIGVNNDLKRLSVAYSTVVYGYSCMGCLLYNFYCSFFN